MHEIYGPAPFTRDAQALARAAANAISAEELAQIQAKAEIDSRPWKTHAGTGVAAGITDEERESLAQCNP